jgi:endonuclease/exonuclease/phosphatase (EEP) superfamily protein YafD
VPAPLIADVRSRHVDVLATDELTIAEQRRLVGAGLPTLLPYRYTAPLPDGGGGIGIWSRYPLAEPRNLPNFELGVLTVRLAAPGGDITFVAAHLLPPYPYPSRIWRGEIARLRTVLTTLGRDRPVIVAGDFNATTDHAQFRALLDRGYADAAESIGAGYQPTYPTDRWFGPVIGIDHVLTRGRVLATDARTCDIRGSDHRALLVEIARPP